MRLDPDFLKKFQSNLANTKNIDELLDTKGPINQLIKHAVEGMLDAELSHHLGYDKHNVKGHNSGNSRNGSSKKNVKSTQGKIELNIPRDRNCSFEPEVVKKGQQEIGVLDNMVISLYAKGLSTRDISSHLEEIYDLDVSAEKISYITNRVLESVNEWKNRALKETYVICYFDAIHFKVREDSQIISKAAYTCLAIDTSGHKHLLGIWVGENEGAKFWLNILSDIKNRGVQDILIACVDGLKGFPEAINSMFPQAEVQLCIIHQIRNCIKYIASKNQKEFMRDLKLVYKASSLSVAEKALDDLDEKWGSTYPLVINSWRTKWVNLSYYFKYSDEIRRLVYTTNIVENLHRQFRKVTKTKSAFPNNTSLEKMIFLAYSDISKKWTMPIRNWSSIISQIDIYFEGRLKLDI